MHIDIDQLTEDELIELNRRIVERLKFLENMHAHREMMQFTPGEKVSFEVSGRGRQTGTIVKLNKKTVSVITDNGRKWNVSPQLHSKVKQVQEVSEKSAKVVQIQDKRNT
jgi:rRNA maturation protein Rpf1